MVEDVVTTGVDALLDILRKNEKIALFDAAKQLHVPADTVQSWVDFLVEERIIGVEYKFTKPFIYLNRDNQKDAKEQKKQEGPQLAELKEEYLARAKEKKIPQQKIPELWLSHIHQELAAVRPFFNEQVQKRGIQNSKEVAALWNAYSKNFLERVEKT